MYLRLCIRRVRGATHSGWCSGERSYTVVVLNPPRCAGYIQSEKWKTSSFPTSRSTLGKPSRLHAVLQVCDEGPVTTIFCSTERPARASLMRGAARGPAIAEAEIRA